MRIMSDMPETRGIPAPARGRFWVLTLGSVGVVYGDIGTSPLYALREALNHAAADGLDRIEVLGVVSLLLWALLLIVTVKYVLFLLRADNRGEGGTLALFALARSVRGRSSVALLVLGIAGAALFYGDAAITPAISVLSAVEGLELIAPDFHAWVLPVTVVIVVALFAVQRHGTGAMAALFGPVTAIWFVTMAAMGALHIADDPGIVAAFDPRYAVSFLGTHGVGGLVVLGAVFLAVTGAEALYADMGHFGRGPIQVAWLCLVFPALALNYLGQGALVLHDPSTLRNPFFLMVPDWALPPLVALATAATVIASQAVITGAFSLSRQAIQLGLLPRLDIRHTSETETGQIYMPAINWVLLGGVLLLVLLFRTSGALASAYGIAVTGTMVVTSLLAFIVVRHAWHWTMALSLCVIAPFVVVEAAFLMANLLKVLDGGYLPVMLAGALMVAMWTWTRGTAILANRTRRDYVPMADFIASLEAPRITIVPGTAIFLTGEPDATPAALLHNLKHNHVLHERNIILTVETVERPRLADDDRTTVLALGKRFTRVTLRYGYMESPNIPRGLVLCRKHGLRFDVMATSFFLGRRTLRPDVHPGMPLWQDRLFIGLAHRAADPTSYYRLPANRVVELGAQVAV